MLYRSAIGLRTTPSIIWLGHIKDLTPSGKSPRHAFLKSDPLDALADIRDECGISQWDGYKAPPISAETLQEAELFLKQLPYSVAKPHVAPTASGTIAFEWRSGNNSIMLITVSGLGNITYAAIINGVRKIHGMEPFIEFIPQLIIDLLVVNFKAV